MFWEARPNFTSIIGYSKPYRKNDPENTTLRLPQKSSGTRILIFYSGRRWILRVSELVSWFFQHNNLQFSGKKKDFFSKWGPPAYTTLSRNIKMVWIQYWCTNVLYIWEPSGKEQEQAPSVQTHAKLFCHEHARVSALFCVYPASEWAI